MEKLDYLQEIGITTVELQPVYEFDETPEETNTKTSADIVATAGENGELPGYRVLNYWGYREALLCTKSSLCGRRRCSVGIQTTGEGIP